MIILIITPHRPTLRLTYKGLSPKGESAFLEPHREKRRSKISKGGRNGGRSKLASKSPAKPVKHRYPAVSPTPASQLFRQRWNQSLLLPLRPKRTRWLISMARVMGRACVSPLWLKVCLWEEHTMTPRGLHRQQPPFSRCADDKSDDPGLPARKQRDPGSNPRLLDLRSSFSHGENVAGPPE